jgi:hypothetical protein
MTVKHLERWKYFGPHPRGSTGRAWLITSAVLGGTAMLILLAAFPRDATFDLLLRGGVDEIIRHLYRALNIIKENLIRMVCFMFSRLGFACPL